MHFEALDGDEDLTALVTHFFENHPELGTSPEGATLPKETHVYRWRVMESMMYAGIPYAKIDMLRHLLEREGHPLTKATYMGGDVHSSDRNARDQEGGKGAAATALRADL